MDRFVIQTPTVACGASGERDVGEVSQHAESDSQKQSQ